MKKQQNLIVMVQLVRFMTYKPHGTKILLGWDALISKLHFPYFLVIFSFSLSCIILILHVDVIFLSCIIDVIFFNSYLSLYYSCNIHSMCSTGILIARRCGTMLQLTCCCSCTENKPCTDIQIMMWFLLREFI